MSLCCEIQKSGGVENATFMQRKDLRYTRPYFIKRRRKSNYSPIIDANEGAFLLEAVPIYKTKRLLSLPLRSLSKPFCVGPLLKITSVLLLHKRLSS
jgi:hypothetical protein